jgi:2-polyprenyl-6-hydroxyphenyl methylase/3-demethylubiquinone-9 3-methyltransferase
MNKNNYKWGGAELSDTLKLLIPKINTFLKEFNPNKELKILDLGCGTGYLTNYLSRENYLVVGSDGSKEGYNLAKKNYPNVEFLNYDSDFLIKNFKGNFDLIISTEVIEHVFNPKGLMKDINSLLSKNGKLFISTPYHGYFKNLLLSLTGRLDKHFTALWEFGHIKFFSIKTLRTLSIETNFKIIKYSGVGRFYPFWKSMYFILEKND